MRHLLCAAALTLAALPVSSQEGEIEEGMSLMEQGAQMLLRGLIDEIEPQLDEFEALAEEIGPLAEMLATEMGPGVLEMMRDVDSFSFYEPPEILPNGDIILRRRPDAPQWIPPDGGAIDL